MNPNDGGRPAGTLDDESPLDELDERLVAYLDGELDSDDRRALELELGRSGALRSRLRSLQEGWELLDDLPLATPSAMLLESTLRMAATEAAAEPPEPATANRSRLTRLKPLATSKVLWVFLLALIGFAGGALMARVREEARFEKQLRLLPVAMHVDAYLHGADVELMRSLMQMPQWQQAVAIADQLGEWDFTLRRSISEVSPEERQRMLPELPIEHQQEVLEAWQRFEQLGEQEQQAIVDVASQVAEQPDAEQLLATMNRFALWRQALPPAQRDQIAGADPQQRKAAITQAIEQTTRQWTQQTSRMLSDQDFETLYQAVRQIARLRIQRLAPDDAALSEQTLGTFGTDRQAMNPWAESRFLRRLFQSPNSEPQFGSPSGPTRGMPPGASSARRPPPRFDLAPSFRDIQTAFEQIQGPLEEHEMWMIESVLSPELSDFLAAASSVEMLREDVLQSWVDDAIRRISSRRSGQTLSERYELIDPSRRDQLDLLEPDKILESLREEGRRRRPSP